MPRIPKNFDSIKKGDIIIFVGGEYENINEETKSAQKYLLNRDGLSQAIHLAIGSNDNEITHLVGNVCSKSSEEIFRAPQNRFCSYVIYRPKDEMVAQAIGAVIKQDVDLFNKIRWKRGAARSLFLPSVNHDGRFTKFSEESVCSKFAIQVLKKAFASESLRDYKFNEYVGLSSNSSPKATDDYFYRNDHYDLLIKTQAPLYRMIYDTTQDILKYYDSPDGSKSKASKVRNAVALAENFLREHPDLSDLHQTLVLMRFVGAPLSEKRGLLSSKKYNEVLKLLNIHGIRENDFLALDLNKLLKLASSSLEADSKPINKRQPG
jgi:hypothetical protein